METTERHLGCKQRLRRAVNDNFGLNRELDGAGTKPMSVFFPEAPLSRKLLTPLHDDHAQRYSRNITMRVLLECHRMGKTALITILVSLSLTVPSSGQTLTAQDAAKLTGLRQRAEVGDVKAQSELGFMYDYGAGGAKRDPTEALKWYRKAAEQGDIGAKQGIAHMFFDGRGVSKDYSEAARWYGCPMPSAQTLTACRGTSYEDLPQGALDLLKKMKCHVSSNYDYGSAVDLNGDGEPEYQVCCNDSPHGPCDAVVIGKIGSAWKDLTAKGGVFGFTDPCGMFIVLDSHHNGFRDICLPYQCSMVSSPNGKPCVPTIWHFVNGRYGSVEYTPATPPK